MHVSCHLWWHHCLQNQSLYLIPPCSYLSNRPKSGLPFQRAACRCRRPTLIYSQDQPVQAPEESRYYGCSQRCYYPMAHCRIWNTLCRLGQCWHRYAHDRSSDSVTAAWRIHWAHVSCSNQWPSLSPSGLYQVCFGHSRYLLRSVAVW